MCGISCILSLSLRSSHHPHNPPTGDGIAVNGINPMREQACHMLAVELDASLDQIRHRGPDARGNWISDDSRVALGHVRLSINDLSPSGAQPFHSSTSNPGVHAIVNGEFYDYDRIRGDLETRHHYAFTSRSDSEIIVALYHHHGLNFTRYLRGEFACVIYDEPRQLFIAVRDRYGIKPLFWTVQRDFSGHARLLVAAEMKAFLPLGWCPEWDVRSLKDAGWNHDARTVFKGVQKIRPGHYLTCQSFGHIEERPYWDASFPDKVSTPPTADVLRRPSPLLSYAPRYTFTNEHRLLIASPSAQRLLDPRSPSEIIFGVRERLLEAVRLRLRADVPIGIYLSGGIDSSVIAGMVTHLVRQQNVSMGSAPPSERITCFSIAFDEDSGFDESGIANRTAEWLGVRYVKKLMSEAELAKRFEDAVWHCEHHNADLNFVGKFALSEVPREYGYKVVLTGEGADETYAGYPPYLPDYLREPDVAWTKYNSLPEAERLDQLKLAENAAQEHYRSIGADAGSGAQSLPRQMLNQISTVTSMTAFQHDLFAAWTDTAFGVCDPEMTIASNVDGLARQQMQQSWHPLHSALYVWSKGHLPNIFLTCLGDRTEMAHSIEARTPFLDHELTAYANNLPASAKLRWLPEERRFVEKWVLREAAQPFITQELYERKKHPYAAPTKYPHDGPLHRLLKSLLTREKVEGLGFVEWGKVDGLVDRAIGEDGEARALRHAVVVAAWVVLAERFGVKKATLEDF